MHRDTIIKGRSLGGTSDLTLLAPIKPGFVESLESATYKTRIKRVLETLHGARTASHEYATARLLSDSIERVGAIHSVRVAVLEPEDKVLLVVTFDGSWESYIRVLWDKVGTLLDLIFCGTVDYVTAYDHTFDEWLVWAHRVQVETGFFYGPPESSARDVLYHRRVESMRMRGLDGTLGELRAVLPSAEDAVQRLVTLATPAPDDPPIAPVGHLRMVRERVRMGFQGLTSLYRLADLHRPATRDGDILRRAALQLLLEFVQMHDAGLIRTQLHDARDRFERQLDWLFPNADARVALKRVVPPPAAERGPIDPGLRADIQGGILHPYDATTHALVMLLAFDERKIALDFLSFINGAITSDDALQYTRPNAVFRNLALTPAGLRSVGLTEDEIELFPQEFRQGMAARAGLLGDVRNNHPRRWRLPGRFIDINTPPAINAAIEIDTVHAVLQVRCQAKTPAEIASVELSDPAHPLRSEVTTLIASVPGLRVLSVQSLKRHFVQQNGTQVIAEHFGYADGNGQPDVEPGNPPFDRNRVQLGEIVLGHDNAADFKIDPSDPTVPAAVQARQRWLCNGSFLVMRKYRQFVSRLQKAVDETAQAMVDEIDNGNPVNIDSYREIVYGKLMGRMRDGTPMAALAQVPPNQNLFDYADDEQGQQCPLHAHVRRAHPRMDPAHAIRIPRLMRRSMSYGPERDSAEGDNDADRGLLFMAYNADLGEQFEVVQRWLTGGNSTGSTAGQSCPIVGVPENGLARSFRFEHADKVFRVELEQNARLFEEPAAQTRLEWGMYLFAPSLTVLRRLCTVAAAGTVTAPASNVPWQLERGRMLVQVLLRVETDEGRGPAVAAWKMAIEDPESIDRLDSAAIWATIREDHGGILKTPYGTLIANRDLLAQVLDPLAPYSVCGQFERMKHSFGEISLGMDAGPIYQQQAKAINDEIGKLKMDDVFKLAFDAATHKIDAIVAEANQQSLDVEDRRFEVGFEAREVTDHVLADLCEEWFGLKDGQRFRRGSADWAWKRGQPPLYPGHFTAMSRYMFQPNPGPAVIELGEHYGQALREAMRQFVEDCRANTAMPLPTARDGKTPALLAKAVFTHPTHGGDNDFVARNMVGVLMGFNPTTIGAVLNVLREWQRDDSFGALRAQLAGATDFTTAQRVLMKPMAAAAKMRPMPQIAWRTVVRPHRLGGQGSDGVDLAIGDVVVLAFVSGTQQALADGKDDGRLMFGGVRTNTPPPSANPSLVNTGPTHACPGWAPGIGAMLGMLTALLTRPENLRPGAAPLTYVLEGPVPKPPAAPAAAAPPTAASAVAIKATGAAPPTTKTAAALAAAGKKTAAATARDTTIATASALMKGHLGLMKSVTSGAGAGGGAGGAVAAAVASSGRVLAWGDSWLDYRLSLLGGVISKDMGTDIRDCLENLHYTMPKKFCVWTDWTRVETMAANPQDFCRFLENEMQLRMPRAILLSGGGNDSTEGPMKALILPKGSPGPKKLDPVKLKAHIEKLRGYYESILSAIKTVFDKPTSNPKKSVPVVVHGYDYPIPRGLLQPKWLFDPFKAKGYDCNQAADLKVASEAMRELIDAFNAMLAGLNKPPYTFVRYVKLSGTIEQNFPNATDGWANDLHPKDATFALMAAKIDALIQTLPP